MSNYDNTVFGQADAADNNWEKGVADCVSIIEYYARRGKSAEMKVANNILVEITEMKVKNAERPSQRLSLMAEFLAKHGGN